MAELVTSVFDMDPNGTVETEDLPTTGQDPQDEMRSSPPQTDGAPGEEPQLHVDRPGDLPPELEERWEHERRKHQRNYSKALDRMQREQGQVTQYKQKAELVDKFYSDPQYAAQTIQQMAQQLGYTLTRADGQGAPGSPGRAPATTMPDWVTQAAETAVADSPDLAFLAPTIAKAAWAISQATVKPLQDEAEQRKTADVERQRQARTDEFERMTAELQEEGIDWQEHEDEMAERLEFLQKAMNGTGTWSHPKYGSFLRFLYSWTTGNRGAQAEAGRRLQKALTNRTSTGTPTRSPGVNTEQLIREAKTPQERWKIAFQSAMAEVPQNIRR